ncbi:hypothetical protein SUGI_0994350 [Cryptomeria japonica]|nr:hypothetical protein SUGI_0994350 [Cryptomeria japonica]
MGGLAMQVDLTGDIMMQKTMLSFDPSKLHIISCIIVTPTKSTGIARPAIITHHTFTEEEKRKSKNREQDAGVSSPPNALIVGELLYSYANQQAKLIDHCGG